MIAIVKPSHLDGHLNVPGSKSFMQRACVLSLLRNSITTIENPSFSDDDKAVMNIIEQLGAKIELQNGGIQIVGNSQINFSGELNCGESGLALRMLVPVVATGGGRVVFSGKETLSRRPVGFFDEVLPQLGVSIKTSGGFLPLEISGTIHPRDIKVDGSLSSQFVTGLLFAYCHAAAPGTKIRVSNAVSKPYIDLSVEMLHAFGYKVLHTLNDEFEVGGKVCEDGPLHVINPGDWSSASFLLVAGAIAGNVKLSGLQMEPAQGDRAILDVLKLAGAHVSINERMVGTMKSDSLKAFSYDATHTPDLFPALVALAIFCDGTSDITGANRLLHKESNRCDALVEVFTALGAKVWHAGNSIRIEGGHQLKHAVVDSFGDHRIAMAAAVAALGATDQVVIKGAESVSKSYPAFFQDIISIGAEVSLT